MSGTQHPRSRPYEAGAPANSWSTRQELPGGCELRVADTVGSVCGDEDVEASAFGRCEESPIMQCRPAAFVRRLDACTLKCATQRRLRSLIEQNFQDDLRANGEAAARVLEDGVNLFAGHTGEPGEKLRHGRAALEVFKEGSHGHTGATEEPFAADPSGDAFNR